MLEPLYGKELNELFGQPCISRQSGAGARLQKANLCSTGREGVVVYSRPLEVNCGLLGVRTHIHTLSAAPLYKLLSSP